MSWLSSREENSTQMSLARKGYHGRDGIHCNKRKPKYRENSKLKEGRFHTGENFGANIPEFYTPEVVREEIARAERLYQQT